MGGVYHLTRQLLTGQHLDKIGLRIIVQMNLGFINQQDGGDSPRIFSSERCERHERAQAIAALRYVLVAAFSRSDQNG